MELSTPLISQHASSKNNDINSTSAATNSVGTSFAKKLLNQPSHESNDESIIDVQVSQRLISTGECENFVVVNDSLHVVNTAALVAIDRNSLESDQQVETMSESAKDSTLLPPKYDVMNTETTKEEHTIKKDFLANRLRNKLLARTNKYTSFVQIYTNKDQDIKIYATVKNEPVRNNESIDINIHKLKISDLSSYDKKKTDLWHQMKLKKSVLL